MVQAKSLLPGTTLSLTGKLYRVDSTLKVTPHKGASFIKVKLRDLISNELIERNFKPDHVLTDVSLAERTLEYLYPEGKEHLFLDIATLEMVLVPKVIVADRLYYLKEGVQVRAFVYGNTVFSIELPQFLELMVSKIEEREIKKNSSVMKQAFLETGAQVEVPPFIEVGDIIKVDTKTNEYIQRV